MLRHLIMISAKHIAGVLIGFALASGSVSAAVVLQPASSTVTAGYYQLHWDTDSTVAGSPVNKAGDFILIESREPGFTNSRTIYRGADTATVISGKPDGTYYYRVGIAQPQEGRPGSWSNSASITVKHHPLSRAFMFFGLGALVFLSTLVVIVRGNLAANDNRE